MRSYHRCWAVSAVLAVACPLAAAQVFDLVEINRAPNPLHPGITHDWSPVGFNIGEASGVSIADVDADGFLDVLLHGTEGEPNQLYMNAGDGTFTEEAAARGVDEPGARRSHSVFFDYDNDGDRDLITLGYPVIEFLDVPLYTLFRNSGAPGFTFSDVTASAGGFAFAPGSHPTHEGYAGGVTVADFDNDGFLDVLATYFLRPSLPVPLPATQMRLWRNAPNPQPDTGKPGWSPRLFVDATVSAGLNLAGVGDGAHWMPSFLDIDRDGDMDLHVNVDFGLDQLHLNNGDGTFGPNVATSVGLNFNQPGGAHEMGVALGDFDNDLDTDLFLTNIGTGDPAIADAFYKNNSDLSEGGFGLSFVHIGPDNQVSDLATGVGWGAAFVDLDLDGDLDLITARGMGTVEAGDAHGQDTNDVFRNLYPQVTGSGHNYAFEDMSAECPDFSRVGQVLDTARALAPFDFDNDGDLDVILTRSGSQPPLGTDDWTTGVFMNTVADAGSKWVELDVVGQGRSLNTVGARAYARTGGVGGVIQTREVRAGTSFLAQEPSRLHFGFGDADPDWVAVRFFNGPLTVLLPEVTPLAGILEVDWPDRDARGDLDHDQDVDCDDLDLLLRGLANPAVLDVQQPDWPWRLAGDMDGNDVLDGRDYVQLREQIGGSWCSLGFDSPGPSPVHMALGELQAGNLVRFRVAQAPVNQTAWLFVGFSPFLAPFYGGTLVPTTDVLMGPFDTGPLGTISLPVTWPANIPSGFHFLTQFWVQGAPNPAGITGSNAVSGLSQ